MIFKSPESLRHGLDKYTHNDLGSVYQNCKFHDPGAGVVVLGCGHIIYIVKMHYFFIIFLSSLGQEK